jgi:6-phosphogluconolactonase
VIVDTGRGDATIGAVVVTREGDFTRAAAGIVADILRTLVPAGEGRVTFALAGGSTPRAVYEVLATLPTLPWNRLEIYFGDERGVPPEDHDSNYRMARESLLDRVPIAPERVHRMTGEEPDLAEAARAYAALLPEALDLLLLGIGDDGHTASLFPGAATLAEDELRVVAATAPVPPYRRLTVTPPVLRRARRILVLASGDAKAPAVARALAGPWDPARCPSQLARRGTWILDPAAAAGLSLGAGGATPDQGVPA